MNFCSVRSSMLRPWLAWCLALLTSGPALASKCYIAEAMGDRALKNNVAFWDEYGVLVAHGLADEARVLALARKYNPRFATDVPQTRSASAAPATSARTPIRAVSHHRRAQQEIERLQPLIKKRYNHFLETLQGPDGVQAFYKNPGSWHYERLIEYGKDAHSVRLNEGFRVLFDVLEDGQVLIRQVNKTIGH